MNNVLICYGLFSVNHYYFCHKYYRIVLKQLEPDRKIFAIVVAGGHGRRFGSDLPKQYLPLDNDMVLTHTLRNFRSVIPADNIITVIAPAMEDFWTSACRESGFHAGPIAHGGATRWESVRNGLMALRDVGPDDFVLVHDAARPFADAALISRVVKALEQGADGAIPVVPVTDSLREVTEDGSSRPVDRSAFRAVQTPQGFVASKLTAAFALPYSPRFTDEATMMQEAGYGNIVLVDGDPRNFKITRPIDLILARAILQQ